ncbi:MAG: hypothetical protein LBV21_01110 [Candidatus Adiutrix sp.]|jgi:hypothetical protein|nr:hypothetical protein [Candidatus Adiutrix sp.]
MNPLETIEKAVSALPPFELAQFRSWFAEFEAQNWDSQIEVDALAEKLGASADEALAD